MEETTMNEVHMIPSLFDKQSCTSTVDKKEIDNTMTEYSTQRKGRISKFTTKLYQILSNSDYQTCISWLPHGRSWKVHEPKKFEKEIIPLYFRQSSYASFLRQVNGWGFIRLKQGTDRGSYHHKLFQKGMPHLCLQMRRIPYIHNHCKTKASTYSRENIASTNPPTVSSESQTPINTINNHLQSWSNLLTTVKRDPIFPPHYPLFQESIVLQENIANVTNQEIDELTRLRKQQIFQRQIQNAQNQIRLLQEQQEWSNTQLIHALGNPRTNIFDCNLKYYLNHMFPPNSIF